jgi:hypothetical protein
MLTTDKPMSPRTIILWRHYVVLHTNTNVLINLVLNFYNFVTIARTIIGKWLKEVLAPVTRGIIILNLTTVFPSIFWLERVAWSDYSHWDINIWSLLKLKEFRPAQYPEFIIQFCQVQNTLLEHFLLQSLAANLSLQTPNFKAFKTAKLWILPYGCEILFFTS